MMHKPGESRHKPGQLLQATLTPVHAGLLCSTRLRLVMRPLRRAQLLLQLQQSTVHLPRMLSRSCSALM